MPQTPERKREYMRGYMARYRAAHPELKRYKADWGSDQRRLDTPYAQRQRWYGRVYNHLKRRNQRITGSLHELACEGPPCSCPPIYVVTPRYPQSGGV